MVISSFSSLKARLQETVPQPAVVAAAHDAHTLEAVFHAQRDGLIRPILVGKAKSIRTIAHSLGQEIPEEDLVDAEEERTCARISVDLIRQGQGRLLIKGMLPTGNLLRETIQPETGIRASELLSHVAILEVPVYHKLLFLTDGGMVIAPDLPQKRAILHNALSLCRFLGYDSPKTAILCAAETTNPRMPETADAAALKAEGAQGAFGPCQIEGPISFDLATDRRAAERKGYHSPVAGDADLLLVPNIVSGNLLGKALYGMAGGTMAGIVLGAAVPITVNSRAATPEEKYNSIAVAAAMAQSSTDQTIQKEAQQCPVPNGSWS